MPVVYYSLIDYLLYLKYFKTCICIVISMQLHYQINIITCNQVNSAVFVSKMLCFTLTGVILKLYKLQLFLGANF